MITTNFRLPTRLPSRFLGAVVALSFLADPGFAQLVVSNDGASGAGSFAAAISQAAAAPTPQTISFTSDGDIALGSPLSVSNTPTIDAAGTTALTIRNALSLSGLLTVNTSAALGTISGVISDGSSAGSLSVQDTVGGGRLTLSGANTFSGGLDVTGGPGGGVTVNAGAAGALGSGAVVMTGLPTSANLNLEGFAQSFASLTGDANSAINLAGATLNVGGSGTSTTFAGTISDSAGTGVLTMNGAGTLVLSGNNSYAGGTVLNAGTLGVTNNGSVGSGAVTFGVGNSAVLQTQGALSSFVNAINLNGNGTLDVDGNTSTFTGLISGAGGLTVTNTNTGGTSDGAVNLLNAGNSYTGGTTVENGALVSINAAGDLGTGGVTLNTGGGLQTETAFTGAASFATAINLAGAGTIDIDGQSSTFNSGIIGGSGALTVLSSAGGGVLTMLGANTYTGGTVIGSRATVGISAADDLGTGGLTFNGGTLQTQAALGTYAVPITLTGAGTVDLYGNATTFTGAIGGAGALTFTDSSSGGGGIAVLQGANSSTGGTDISAGVGSGGVAVQAGIANALGSGSLVMTGGSSSANLNLEGFSETIASLGGDLNSTLDLNGAALTISGAPPASGVNTTFAGVIKDALGGVGTLTMNETGGTLVLSGQNTYAGGTTLDAGTLGVTNNASLGAGGLTMNGGTLQTAAALTNFNTAINLAGAGTIDLDGQTSSFAAGIINGSGALTFTNSGAAGAVLTLQGTNGFTGGSTLATGAIVGIQQTGALGTGGLTFNGGTLQTQAALNDGSAVTMTGAGTVDVFGNAATLSGTIGGAGALKVTDNSTNGGGSLTLSGAGNSYSGGTTVAVGSGASGVTLFAGAQNALGSGGVTLTGANGANGATTATLNLQGNAQTIASLSANQYGVLDLYGGALTVSGGTPASTIFAGVLQDSSVGGAGTLTLNETGGTLVLSGANTYAGGTTLSAGTLGVANNASLGGGTLTLDGGTLQTQAALTGFGNAISLGGSATVDIAGFTSTFSGEINGAGTLSVINSGTGGVLNVTNSLNGFTGGTEIGAGATVGVYENGNLGIGTLTFNGGALRTQNGLTQFSVPIDMAAAGTVDLYGQQSYFSGAIGGAGPLTITDSSHNGGGSLTLLGSNTGTGGLDVTAGAGGIGVQADAPDALGAGAVVMNGAASSANLGLGGYAESISSLAGDAKSTLNLDGAALTVGGSGTTTTFAGLITDSSLAHSGSLTMSGAGTLVLTGANTYAGGTTLSNGGTIAVRNNASLGAGIATFNGGVLQTQAALTNFANAVNLAGAGTIDLDGNSSAFTGGIGGAGGLSVLDSGTGGVLTLSGSDSFTGGTVIESGATLALAGNGSLGAGSLNVNSGGTFELNGLNRTIGGGVVNNGTIVNGLGTLTAPSYSGAGTLNLSLQTSAPALNVTGAANVAGGTFTLGNHPGAGTYTAIAAGALSGTFSAVNVSADYLPAAVTYTGNDVTLTLTPRLSSYVQTPNQRAVANALFNIGGNTSPDLRAVLNELDALSPAQANAALDQIGPRAMVAMGQMQYAASNLQTSAIGRHLGGLAVGGANPGFAAGDPPPAGALIASGGVGDTPETWNNDTVKTKDYGEYFGTLTGSQGRIDPLAGSSGTQPGFKFDAGGATVGVNTSGSEDFVLGFALGYVGSSAQVDSSEGSLTAQSVRGGVFVAKRIDDFHGNLYLGGAFDSFSTTHSIPLLGRDATSGPSGEEVDFAGSASYDLHLRRLTLTPTAGLSADHLAVGPAKESGAGSMDLDVGSQDLHSVRSDTGAKLSYRFGGDALTFTPYASAAYEHEFMNQSESLNAQFVGLGGPFSITTADVARGGLLLAGGFAMDWKSGTTLRVEYSKDTRTNYDVNTVLLNMSARFQ